MNKPPKTLHGDQSATASDCSESTSSQPPLKRFQLLAQDMMEHSSAACSGHCVKHCGHWTGGLFCWLQELLRKQWT